MARVTGPKNGAYREKELAFAHSVVIQKGRWLGDGNGSGGSTLLTGSPSVLDWRQYAVCGFMHMRIQHTTASFFYRKPYLKFIRRLSAKVDQGTSCAQFFGHPERGL